jgi:hypothetical protein
MSLIVPAQFPGFSQLLFKLIGANMNVTTDQLMSVIGGSLPAAYMIDAIRVANASISLDTAAGGVYTAITKPAGGIIVAAAQAYSDLTGPTLALDLTLTALGKAIRSTAPYFSLTTAQGAAATADIYVFGRVMTGV